MSLPPAKPAMRTVVRFIQKEGRVWGELLSFIFFAFTRTFLFLIFAPPRYLMDVPHHWEGWVVGEELGSLSNDGDADCPVWIRTFLSLIDLFANTFEIYRTITFLIAQASLGSGWDVANGNDWQEDSSLTITCSFWSYCNRDVDNILSKKFKPSSSHILEIYFEKKLGFTSTFGQTC